VSDYLRNDPSSRATSFKINAYPQLIRCRATNDAIARARADYHAICFARHHPLSVGAVLRLPQMDKFGNPVRHDCKRLHDGEPCEASGQIVFTEKVVMPDIRGLQFKSRRSGAVFQPYWQHGNGPRRFVR
jgi:hypothetical protein